MAVMASDGPSPHSPWLRFGLPAPKPSRRHHAQSLLGPSFHNPRTHHVLESNPEQAAPLSRRDDERCHAIVSHSALALPSPSCSLQHFLKLSLLSLRPSLLQFVSIVSPHSPSLRLGLPCTLVKILHRHRRVSPRRPMYLLIVGLDYCVMCFA